MHSLISLQVKAFLDIASCEESSILSHKWYNYVNDFRVGNFEVAKEEVKTAWITFVDNIIVKINVSWKKDETKSNKLLSEIVNVSDEAYALHVSANKMDFWVNEAKSGKKGKKRKPVAANATKQDNNDEEDRENLRLNPEYQSDIDNYYDWFEKITEKRKTEDEGSSWEIGYKNSITISKQNLPSSVSVASAINSLDASTGSGQDGYHGGRIRNIPFEDSWKEFE